MKKNIDNFRRGYLGMFLLKVLSEEDYYGYEIIQILRQVSKGVLDFTVGTIYPVLYKMEAAGYITSYEVKSGPKMVRNYYHLTDSGRGALEEMINDFQAVIGAADAVLSYKKEKHQEEVS